MGITNHESVMRFFSLFKARSQPEAKSTPNFRDVLSASIQIVCDFGKEYEHPHPEDGIGPLQSESRLPHPRESIMFALEFLIQVIENEKSRTASIRALPPEQAQYLLSDKFKNALLASRIALDCYVPEAQLEQQRAAAALVAESLDQLGKEGAKILKDSPLSAILQTARATKPKSGS